MEEALERGFLRAPNRKRLKFALMWANHDWSDYFPAPYDREWNMWLPIRHSARDIHRVVDYCIEHYFRQPNYWRVNDRLFFSLFQPQVLIDQLGGVMKTQRVFGKVDRRLRSRGLPPMHWNAMTWSEEPVAKYKAAGFASTTSYNFTSGGKGNLPVNGIEEYTEVMDAHRQKWRTLSGAKLPYMPVVTMGWDVTSRCLHDVKWPFQPAPGQKQQKYPYGPVVVGNTPQRFEQLCRDARALMQHAGVKHHAVFLNAWNEWTEGCYLLPEKRYGDGYLKAVRSAFGLPVQKTHASTRSSNRRPDVSWTDKP